MPGPTTLISALMLLSSLKLPLPAFENGVAIAERAGVTPAAAACAGVDTARVQTLIAGFASQGDRWAQVQALQTAIDRAIGTIADSQERLELDPGDTEAAASLAAAHTELALSNADLRSARRQLVQGATGWMGEEARGLLESVGAAQRHGLPAEFAALGLGDHGLRQLRLALLQERRAERRGEAVPDPARTLLRDARGRQEVIAAKSRLAVNLPGVRAVWDQSR